MNPIPVPQGLHDLAAVYAEAGHSLWLVGGCVRDHIRGVAAKDIDLATTATPDEQVALCDAAGYRWFGTGLQHGTLTVLADGEPYEITTLRTDVETDGRHAVVAYTSDLLTDLERRDLTFNAIAMTFDGEIVDPFGGVADALAGRVRFVGDAGRRIREDYLRILRWFRFKGRYASDIEDGGADLQAIAENASGIAIISVERVWSEMSRILAGTRPAGIIELMDTAGVLKLLGLPGVQDRSPDCLAEMRRHTNDPAALLAAWLGLETVFTAVRWKLSTADRENATFIANRMARPSYDLAAAKRDLVDGTEHRLIEIVLKTRGNAAAVRALDMWETPVFPVQGRDLVAAGMKPGPKMGEVIRRMRDDWTASDYTLTRAALMETAIVSVG